MSSTPRRIKDHFWNDELEDADGDNPTEKIKNYVQQQVDEESITEDDIAALLDQRITELETRLEELAR